MNRLIVGALVFAFAFPVLVAGQTGSAPGVLAQVETTAAPAGAAEARQAEQPLGTAGAPARTPQARTMRAYWHVFIAFAATWLLLFGYVLSVGRRFGRLEEDVRRLRGEQP